MKKYMINVNGKSYEVEVEEIGGVAAPRTVAPAAVSAPTPAPAAAPAAPAAAPAPAAGPVPQGSETIVAPMPGKVMSIKVKVGQTVKAGDLILTLEAMKMENEIYCGDGGKVLDIRVSEGALVNANDVLVVIG